MKISGIIKRWTEYIEKYGDVEIHHECGDGRSTWSEPYTPYVRREKNWYQDKPQYMSK